MTSPLRPDLNSSDPNEGEGFSKRILGLPMWGWTAIGAVGGIGLFLWWRAKGNSSATDTGSTDTTGSTGGTIADGLNTDQYESILSLLKDIQGEDSKPITPTPDNDKDSDDDKWNEKHPLRTSSVVVKKYHKGEAADYPSSLARIVKYAKAHGVNTTISKLEHLNNLKNSTVHPGERIYYIKSGHIS